MAEQAGCLRRLTGQGHRPDAVGRDCHRTRVRQRDVLDGVAREWIDPVDAADLAGGMRQPDGIRADGERREAATAEVDAPREGCDGVRRLVDAHHLVELVAEQPHAAVPRTDPRSVRCGSTTGRPETAPAGFFGPELPENTPATAATVSASAAATTAAAAAIRTVMRCERRCLCRPSSTGAAAPVATVFSVSRGRVPAYGRDARPAPDLPPSGSACPAPWPSARSMTAVERTRSARVRWASAAARPDAPRAPRARTRPGTGRFPSGTDRAARQGRRCRRARRRARRGSARARRRPVFRPTVRSLSVRPPRRHPVSARSRSGRRAPPRRRCVTSTFAGFTSRWTSPRACAASSASATCATRASARSGDSDPSAAASAGRFPRRSASR